MSEMRLDQEVKNLCPVYLLIHGSDACLEHLGWKTLPIEHEPGQNPRRMLYLGDLVRIQMLTRCMRVWTARRLTTLEY